MVAEPVATLVCLHPLPTAGGFMDSHILRKAAARLPALATYSAAELLPDTWDLPA